MFSTSAAASSASDSVCWRVADHDRWHRITVGANVLVSKDDANAMHAEIYIAADPTNVQRLVACGFSTTTEDSVFDQSGQWNIVYASRDGGVSWKATRRSNSVGSDPSCAFDRPGRAHFLSSSTGALPIYHSDDGGAHWSRPSTTPGADNVYLVPDAFLAGKFGRLYVAGQYGPFMYSDDGGGTFTAVRAKEDRGEQVAAGPGATLSDGTLVWPHLRSRDPKAVGYGTEPKPGAPSGWIREWMLSPTNVRKIAKVSVGTVYHPATLYGSYAPMAPIAVDTVTKMFHDRLYTIWTDSRSGRGQVLFSSSSDRGKTWTVPFIMDDDRTKQGFGVDGSPDDFMPMLAVNKNGVVGVAWYDRRDNPDNLGWYVRFRASLDGGATWLPSVRVSAAPESYASGRIDPRDVSLFNSGSFAALDHSLLGDVTVGFHDDAFRGGDYTSMAADAAGNFHPVWIDNRTGVPNMWTSEIQVTGSVRRRAYPKAALLVAQPQAKRMQNSVELFGMNPPCQSATRPSALVGGQVTSPISLLLSGLRYDPSSRIISVWARVQNLSNKSLRGPFDLTLASVDSARGTVEAVNAQNGETGPGASSSLLQDAAPHDYTDAAFMEFRLAKAWPFRRVAGGCGPKGRRAVPSQLLLFTARLIRTKK